LTIGSFTEFQQGLSPARLARGQQLDRAAGWLRSAITLQPDDSNLRLHLGRVLALTQEDAEALSILQQVAASPAPDDTACLALLFVAAIHERAGRLDEATTAYRGAVTRYPRGHAAYIGLSEVLQRTGHGVESREVLQRLVTESAGPTDDPWWWYRFEKPGLAESRLAALREEVRR
jgi:predicted Zn-dependent protease